MSHTYYFHFSLDIDNQPNYLPLLQALSLKVIRKYLDIPVYDHPHLMVKQQLFGPGLVNWYIGSLTTSNIDLLAFVYQYLCLLPPPIIFGFDLETLRKFCSHESSNPNLDKLAENLSFLLKHEEEPRDYIFTRCINKININRNILENVLSENGYLKNSVITHRSKDYFFILRAIEENVQRKNYEVLGDIFKELTNNEISDENFKENLFIKRLNSSRIVARDILPLYAKSNNSEFISENYDEYVSFIDELLSKDDGETEKNLHKILVNFIPTIDSLTEPKTQKLYSYKNGEVKLYNHDEIHKIGKFYTHPITDIICYCNKGIIFEYFPDPIHAARYTDQPIVDKSFLKLWTTLHPTTYEEMLHKGYFLYSLDTYKHSNWRFSKREPDFTELNDTRFIVMKGLVCKYIIYKGRSHNINGVNYFEIDAIRYKEKNVIGNALIENIYRLFWNAENLLRTKHNLPRIGEGWLSEMRMYQLIFNSYTDSIHHYSPDWLKPQHYDVYIPSLKIAIEYQGKQHYEPVDFFGSNKSFEDNIRRDKLKLKKSIKNHIKLVYWKYDEPINHETLENKIKTAHTKTKSSTKYL